MFKAYYGAYWLVKEEISNRKFQSLLDLLKFLGLDEMEHFQYFSAEMLQEKEPSDEALSLMAMAPSTHA